MDTTAIETHRKLAGVSMQTWGVACGWGLRSCCSWYSSFSIKWKGWHPIRWWGVAGGGDTRWQGLRGWNRLVSPIPIHLSCKTRHGPLHQQQFVLLKQISKVVNDDKSACKCMQGASYISAPLPTSGKKWELTDWNFILLFCSQINLKHKHFRTNFLVPTPQQETLLAPMISG
jgi:hypothetical protein